MDDLEKQWGTSSILSQALCIISSPSVNSNWRDNRETLNSGRIWYFVPCDLAIWWMTLKNNRAPLLYYIKICASFQSHGWIQTGVTVRKHSIRVKIGIFCPIWLEIWRMTLKSIGHRSYAAWSFVLNFIAIDKFKLKLQSGNSKFGSKSTIF